MPLFTQEPFPDLPEWTPEVSADDAKLKWRLYEKVVADMQERYPDCTVIRDHKVTGVRSGTTRQIDVWVAGEVVGREIKLAIECKFYKAKVDIKTVDSFIGFLEACFIVGVEKGDVTDISACTRHKSDNPDENDDD